MKKVYGFLLCLPLAAFLTILYYLFSTYISKDILIKAVVSIVTWVLGALCAFLILLVFLILFSSMKTGLKMIFSKKNKVIE